MDSHGEKCNMKNTIEQLLIDNGFQSFKHNSGYVTYTKEIYRNKFDDDDDDDDDLYHEWVSLNVKIDTTKNKILYICFVDDSNEFTTTIPTVTTKRQLKHLLKAFIL